MFAISLIHGGRRGGSFTVMEKTLAECKRVASKVCDKFPSSYVVCTITYAVYRRKHYDLNPYDATIPFEIKKCLGIEWRLTMSEEDQ